MAASPWNSLKFLKGDPITLESGKGKTVFVLEFWATWCPPCRTSIPHLTELQHRYADKGVVFIGVTDEQERAVQRFVQQMGLQMDYRVATDTTGEVQSAYMGRYGESGIPCAFVIDRSGRITYHGHPMEPQFESALSAAANTPSSDAQPTVDIRGKSRDELMAMPVRELKQVLTDHHVNIAGLLEKTDLVDRVMQIKSNIPEGILREKSPSTMIRDLVGPGCDPNSRNPLGTLVDQFESVPRSEEKAGEIHHPSSEIEAVQVDAQNRLRDRTSIFARQLGDDRRNEAMAKAFNLSPEEMDAYQNSIRKQLENFSLDVPNEDLTHFHGERSELWAQEMAAYLDRSGLEAMMHHQLTPEDLMREFPYQLQENNPFLLTMTSADDAIKLYENGDLADAVLALEAIVQRQPNNSTAWRWLGTVHAENDEDKLAIASLLRAFQADPENLDALLDLGVSFTNELAQHQALNYLKLWIEKHPRYSSIAARMTFSEEDTGLLGFQRMHRKVTDMFLMAAEMNPRDANVYTVLGVLYNLSREFDKAERAFRSGLEVDPRNYSLWNKLGATQANSTHLEGSKEAVFAYRKALELKPNYVRAWVNMGISYANQGKNNIAIRYYTKALIQNPTAEHVWGYLRVAFSVLGNELMAERAAAKDLSLLNEASLV